MNHLRMILLAAVFLAVGLAHSPAVADTSAETGYRGWGPRVGLSSGPDQIHFGAHMNYGNFAKHVRFQPNVELGLSDHHKLFAINAEAAYRFTERWDVWSPYLGGGIGANIKSWDDGRHNDSQTDLGVNFLGGIEKGLNNGDRFFIEAKISLNDIPDLKITVGWTFYH